MQRASMVVTWPESPRVVCAQSASSSGNDAGTVQLIGSIAAHLNAADDTNSSAELSAEELADATVNASLYVVSVGVWDCLKMRYGSTHRHALHRRRPWPLARVLSFCWRSLSIAIGTPKTGGRGGCSGMTSLVNGYSAPERLPFSLSGVTIGTCVLRHCKSSTINDRSLVNGAQATRDLLINAVSFSGADTISVSCRGLTAAIPMENPYCSCKKLTLVRDLVRCHILFWVQQKKPVPVSAQSMQQT